MPVISTVRFARLLLRPTATSFLEFVADWYAARGWNVDRDGRALAVTHPRTKRTNSVHVAAARSRLTATAVPDDADFVVARRDTAWCRDAAATVGAEFVGPDELRESLLYDAPRAVADEVMRRHFDRSVVEPPPGNTVAVASAVLLVVAVTVVGANLFATGVTSPADSAAIVESDNATETRTATPTQTPVRAYPPGVDEEGIRDAERLARVHSASLDNRSYQLLLEQRQSLRGGADGRWYESRQSLDVENDTRYYAIVEGTSPDEVANGTHMSFVAYADGDTVHYRNTDGYDRSRYDVQPLNEHGRITDLAARYIVRFLSTSESGLSDILLDSQGEYLVAASGDPARIDGNVTDYRAVATVSPNGVVSHLEASYVITEGNETRRVVFTFRYDAVGKTDVSPPPWYEKSKSQSQRSHNVTVDPVKDTD